MSHARPSPIPRWPRRNICTAMRTLLFIPSVSMLIFNSDHPTSTMAARGHVWSDFSFVVSSGDREKVLTSLAPKPKVPRQLADETDLRVVHVSRALRELSDRGLVECLPPEVKARGRL